MSEKADKVFQVQYLTLPKLTLAVDHGSLPSLTSTSFLIFIEEIVWWTATEVTANVIITVMAARFIHKIHALIQVCKCEKMNQANYERALRAGENEANSSGQQGKSTSKTIYTGHTGKQLSARISLNKAFL